jgi:hypothetical protein
MAIDVSFLRGLDPSAVTPPTARESPARSTGSFSHRAEKIKMSRLSRSTCGEAGLAAASLIRNGLGGKASRDARYIYSDITLGRQYSCALQLATRPIVNRRRERRGPYGCRGCP